MKIFALRGISFLLCLWSTFRQISGAKELCAKFLTFFDKKKKKNKNKNKKIKTKTKNRLKISRSHKGML